jgi:hypothetical protein
MGEYSIFLNAKYPPGTQKLEYTYNLLSKKSFKILDIDESI